MLIPAPLSRTRAMMRRQSAGANRTNDGQDQALQTYRATLREDGNKLCLIPRTRLRIHLDQIRPHGLTNRFYPIAVRGLLHATGPRHCAFQTVWNPRSAITNCTWPSPSPTPCTLELDLQTSKLWLPYAMDIEAHRLSGTFSGRRLRVNQ